MSHALASTANTGPELPTKPQRAKLAFCRKALCLLTLSCLAACSDLGPGADYYYPIDELHDGVVYAYQPVGDAPFPPYYWYYRAVETPDSTMLAGTFYSQDFEPLQFTNERITPTGSLRRSLRMYTPTDTASTQVVAEILAPNLFSFEQPNQARRLTSAMRWTQPAAVDTLMPVIYTVTHQRRYLQDTTLELDGESYPAQAWRVDEVIEHDSIGVLELESQALEIYAEGIGLAYRQRVYSDGTLEAYRLAARFPMDTLEAIARRQ